MSAKIYFTYKEVTLPGHVSRIGRLGRPTVINKSFDFVALTTWPNGKPCTLVNLWLNSISASTDGETDTTSTYASQISHLIRYCWGQGIAFIALSDADFYDWAKTLLEKRHRLDSSRPARGANHIRTIMSTGIRFLMWYQNTFLSKRGTLLIGDMYSNTPITVYKKINPKTNKPFFYHSAFPKIDVDETISKHPISDAEIDAIQDEISRRSQPNSVSRITENRAGYNHKKLGVQLDYEYERRTFNTWMLERFGARPSEIHGTLVSLNSDIVKHLILKLPTSKTRYSGGRLRSLPISISDALRIKRYFDARGAFVAYFESQIPNFIEPQGIMLTKDCKDIKLSSISRDFYRLKKSANLLGSKLTQSMYRHRFITYQVLIKLREQAEASHSDPMAFSHEIHFSILKEVASLTGHKDPNSLWDYIHIAYGLLRVTNSIDSAIRTLSEAQNFRQLLSGWMKDLESCNSPEEKLNILERIRIVMDQIKVQAR
ncbi:hypothetical protein [Pseudomonas viridiflava]|uniref:hypothetical protein n=1 Tax=Pseudomonas viridiflava TaxID=33069 RepID=UPI00106EB650|nr:hypothetical protein [Pseudomonas viridiflava]